MTSEFGVVTRVRALSRSFQTGKTLQPDPKTFSEPSFIAYEINGGRAHM
jgi:hypothetical protein